MVTIEIERTIPAARDRVWARYTDHVSWSGWAKMGKVRLEREGDGERNGSGCVRVISNAGISVAEEVLDFDAPHRMTYTVRRGGIPIKDHLGEVTMEERDGATLLTWRCHFRSRIPGLGWLWKLLVSRMFATALAGLERDLAGQPAA